jgi:hypothetical protein
VFRQDGTFVKEFRVEPQTLGTSMTEGGIRIPSVPPAVIVPDESFPS